MTDADIKEINRVRKIYKECHVFDQTLILNDKKGNAFKMRAKGATLKEIASDYSLTRETIRCYCSKAARLARSATTRNVRNGNDKQEVPVNDISESDFNESGLCASGYILRLRDIARNLSSQ